MLHFLLGLPAQNIRRKPYIAASVAPPPFRAAELGVRINPRGLLYCVPGISSWVGGDLTAGILAADCTSATTWRCSLMSARTARSSLATRTG